MHSPPENCQPPAEIPANTAGIGSDVDPLIRIIDANLNRAREGLRVIEDIARFALDDAPRTQELKALRHELVDAASRLPCDACQRLAHRDTPADVGTGIVGSGEMRRTGLAQIALAAFARLGEALRSLEEAAKALPGASHAAQLFEQLRYRAYEAEKRLIAALPTARARQWTLCVLITEALCTHHPWDRVATLAIEGGADSLQLREKSLADAELLARARRLVDLARAAPSRPAVILNDRPDLALLSGADAVHVGQDDLPLPDVRAIAGHRLLVGASTTNLDQARAARRAGADYVGLGPMFPSTTKHKQHLAGPAYLRAVLDDPDLASLPHLAIGGITPENIATLRQAGCRGVAVSSAVCGAADPAVACRRLVEALGPARLHT